MVHAPFYTCVENTQVLDLCALYASEVAEPATLLARHCLAMEV